MIISENDIEAPKPKVINVKGDFNRVCSNLSEESFLKENNTNSSNLLYNYMILRNTYLKSNFDIILLRMINNLSKKFHSYVKKAELIKMCKLFLLTSIELCYVSLVLRQIISIDELKPEINEMLLYSIATISKFKISNDSTADHLITYLFEFFPNLKQCVSSFSNQVMCHRITLDFSFSSLNYEFNCSHKNNKSNNKYVNHNSLVDYLVNTTLPHKKTRLLLTKNKEENEAINSKLSSLNIQESQNFWGSPLKKMTSDNNNNHLFNQLVSNEQEILLYSIESEINKINNSSNNVTYSISIQDDSNSIKDLYFEKKKSITKQYTFQNEGYNEFDEICSFLNNKSLNLRKQSYEVNEEDSYFI